MRLGFVILLVLVATRACAGSDPAQAGAMVSVSSSPAGLDTWANGVYLGRSPVRARLAAGRYVLRLAEPSDSLYRPPAVDTLITVTDGEEMKVHLAIGRSITIRSVPFGLDVMNGPTLLGHTPLDLRLNPSGANRLMLLTEQGTVAVPIDSLLRRGEWTYRGSDGPRALSTVERSRPLWRSLGRYAMPGIAAALAVMGGLSEGAADRSFERYRKTGDPELIRRDYDEARRKDRLAVVFWAGAEVSLVSAIFSWIWPDQPEPAVRDGGPRE